MMSNEMSGVRSTHGICAKCIKIIVGECEGKMTLGTPGFRIGGKYHGHKMNLKI